MKEFKEEDIVKYIKAQSLKFGYIEKCGAERVIKIISKWNPVEMRSWDNVMEDLSKLKVRNWANNREE